MYNSKYETTEKVADIISLQGAELMSAILNLEESKQVILWFLYVINNVILN